MIIVAIIGLNIDASNANVTDEINCISNNFTDCKQPLEKEFLKFGVNNINDSMM